MNVVRSFVNYAIIRELCDRMRFEVDCAKSHHRVISEGLLKRLSPVFQPIRSKTKITPCSSVQFSLFLPFQLYVYIYIYKYPNYEI